MTLRLSGGRRLQSPPGDTARPTAARVRQAVLNLLAAELPGCRWLDLCCGSGVMACEALQRGAAEVVAIERDRRVAAVAHANLEAVAAGMGPPSPRLRVIQADARRWLASAGPASGIGGRQGRDSSQERGGGEASDAVTSSVDPQIITSRSRGPRAGEEDLPARANPSPSAWESQRLQCEGRPLDRGEQEQPFDLIYCDPPWPLGLHAPLSEAVARGGWIRPCGTLVWECPSEEVPLPPAGWTVRDRRRYGGSTVVLLEPL